MAFSPSVNTIVLPCDLRWDVTGITDSRPLAAVLLRRSRRPVLQSVAGSAGKSLVPLTAPDGCEDCAGRSRNRQNSNRQANRESCGRNYRQRNWKNRSAITATTIDAIERRTAAPIAEGGFGCAYAYATVRPYICACARSPRLTPRKFFIKFPRRISRDQEKYSVMKIPRAKRGRFLHRNMFGNWIVLRAFISPRTERETTKRKCMRDAPARVRRARYCETMPTSVLPSHMYWHRWFAWRPVIVYDRAGRWRVVWLHYIERRWTLGRTSGLGPRWLYRRVQTGERDH
jgi:hypothetical protein